MLVAGCVVIIAQPMPRIEPVYHASIDYGTLSKEQRKVMDDILATGAEGNEKIYQNLTLEEFDEVISYIGLYYGSTLANWNVALWRKGFALVNVELIQTLEQRKSILDRRINSIVASMYDGTDRFKLWQISNYIAATVDYSYLLDDIEPLSGLAGKGSCMTYSMLFYKMATAAGIQTCICYGTNHAWNMVEIDGKQYFYDVTWYDNIVWNARYIHSKTSWGRKYVINNCF